VVKTKKYNRCACTNTLLVPKVEKLTLEPLLGPIGGGLGLGAASAAGAAAVAGAPAAAGSSDARTTSLEEEEEPKLLDFNGNINMVLLEDEAVVAATLSDNINPQAADAMLLLAITIVVVVVYVFVCFGNLKVEKK
jgi:hypothetical protein